MNYAHALHNIKETIQRAASDAGRSAGDITLIAVSKTHKAAAIEELITAGHSVFGENRVQEAVEKFMPLKEKYSARHFGSTDIFGLRLHLIGPLQTNKVADAVRVFDVIHTLDRIKLAEKLAAEMQKQNKKLDCFIQVNIGAEPQKAGVLVTDLPDLIATCRALNLPIIGLMCIPPVEQHPAPHFALLKKLAHENGLEKLSMGMSADFETAIACGATHIRVGSALFGMRADQQTSRPVG